MKLIAMTLASLSLLASSVAQADPTRTRDDVRAVAPALEKYRQDTLFGDLWKRPGLNLARPQHRHARGADHAQSDRRDGALSQLCAR